MLISSSELRRAKLCSKLFGNLWICPSDGDFFLNGFFLWGTKRDYYQNDVVLSRNGKFLIFKHKTMILDCFLNGIGNSAKFESYAKKDRIMRNSKYFMDNMYYYSLDFSALNDIVAKSEINPMDRRYIDSLNMCWDILRTLKSITMQKMMSSPCMEIGRFHQAITFGDLPSDYAKASFKEHLSCQVLFMLRTVRSNSLVIV